MNMLDHMAYGYHIEFLTRIRESINTTTAYVQFAGFCILDSNRIRIYTFCHPSCSASKLQELAPAKTNVQ